MREKKHKGVSIFERASGTFQLRWKSQDGSRPCRTVNGNRDKAEREAVKISKIIKAGKVPAKTGTFSILEELLEDSFFPLHSQEYNNNIRAALKKASEKLSNRLKNIQPIDIDTAMAEMIKKGLSPVTVNGWKRNCASAFEIAKRSGLISNNPFKEATKLKETCRPIREISENEEKKIFSICKNARDRLMIAFALYGGMRTGEIAGFDIRKDIRENYNLVVRASKTGKWRIVLLPEKYKKELKRYVTARRKKYDPVPFGRSGNCVSVRIHNILKKAGVEARPHDLRETCGTRLARKGMNPWRLKEYLGHASVRTTERYYVGLLDPEGRDTVWS